MTSESQIQTAIEDIENTVANYASTGTFTSSDIEEVKTLVETAMANHPYYKIEIESEMVLDENPF